MQLKTNFLVTLVLICGSLTSKSQEKKESNFNWGIYSDAVLSSEWNHGLTSGVFVGFGQHEFRVGPRIGHQLFLPKEDRAIQFGGDFSYRYYYVRSEDGFGLFVGGYLEYARYDYATEWYYEWPVYSPVQGTYLGEESFTVGDESSGHDINLYITTGLSYPIGNHFYLSGLAGIGGHSQIRHNVYHNVDNGTIAAVVDNQYWFKQVYGIVTLGLTYTF